MKKPAIFVLSLLLFSFTSIRPGSLTDKERKDAIDLLSKTEQGVFDAVKGLSDAQLKFKAAPDRWSVEECVKHIAMTEQALWQMTSGAMKETATAEKSSTGLHQIELGVHPDVPSNRSPIALRPGDSMEVTLGNEYGDIKKLVEKRVSIDKINTVTVRPQTALFNDGTMFFAGMLYRRDPNKPGKWITIQQ